QDSATNGLQHFARLPVRVRLRLTLRGLHPMTTQKEPGKHAFRLDWVEARSPTPRERELFAPTEFTKPVDFHSFRRAYKQALADAGVDLQQAMALSGASDVKAHQRYLAN